MTYLVLVSILWAFSFGLIRQRLVAADPFVVAFLRLAVSCLVFLPWLRPARLAPALRRRCLAWGAIQFGLMYVLYTAAFRDLTAAAVAVLTVLTPLYVALLDDARARRVRGRRLVAAALAVVGAVVVVWRGGGEAPAWRGALLVQGANLCFAAGQLAYRDLARRGSGAGRTPTAGPAEATLTAWMYLGAAVCTGLLALLLADPARLAPLRAPGAWSALLYLGLLPTALGFHLWNRGAARVTAGLLAVANNLKVPLGVLVAWLVFGETAARGRTAVGLVLVLMALVLAREKGAGAVASRPPEIVA